MTEIRGVNRGRFLGWCLLPVGCIHVVQAMANNEPDDGSPSSDSVRGERDREWFVSTQWSVVLAARDPGSSQAAEPLARLCRTYWYPLYAYIRRRGHEPHDAQDLTQEFFPRLLEKNFLTAVRQERGKFRWFLLSALKRFLANEWNHDHATKRGGGQTVVSLNEETTQGRYRCEIADHTTPDRLFDQNWAMTLLEQAQTQLQLEYGASHGAAAQLACNLFNPFLD